MATKRKPILARVQKFEPSEAGRPLDTEMMGEGMQNVVQDQRVRRQMKAQAKQKPKYTEI